MNESVTLSAPGTASFSGSNRGEVEAVKARFENQRQTVQTGKEVINDVVAAERRLTAALDVLGAATAIDTAAVQDKLNGFERNVDQNFKDNALRVVAEAANTNAIIAAAAKDTALAAAATQLAIATSKFEVLLAVTKDGDATRAQIAECCCETKLGFEKLFEQAQAIKTASLEDQLAAARLAIATGKLVE